jgi:methionyl-tRNA formyltransferase
MIRRRVIFMGTPEFSVPILQSLALHHTIVAVYCQPPRPAGRGQTLRPSPVQEMAERLHLSVRHPASLKDDLARKDFAELKADVAVVVAYGLILPQAVLDMPQHGCLNIHASLLPRWRGAAPIHRAILAGDSETGICIMQMDAGLDTGPVLMRQAVQIGPEDTTADLHDRLSQVGAGLIIKALDQLGQLHPEPQPNDGVTYATKIDKAEARIDWNRTAVQVDRQIRGLSPFPGAWCMAGKDRIKLLRSRVVDGGGAPGQVLGPMRIACGTGAVEVTLAQREGKRPMDLATFVQGYTLPERLE